VADLTLPGSIAGLLRRGSPVVVISTEDQTTDAFGTRLQVGDRAVLTDDPTGRWCIATGATYDDLGPPWSELAISALALDLTDETGRCHAAWWAIPKLVERYLRAPGDSDRAAVERYNADFNLLLCATRLHPAATLPERDLDVRAFHRLCLDLAGLP
jgi:hypothetical protein